ncbi:hypothetical protein GCM10025734_77790 [Kitasatospora paranensis]|uniref:glycoside hydrolase family 20 zincin-like fold domain-containing protein n=1 Tax=Kitasatospora paranensis TaxID=258053 RepID=UPI003384A7FA
MRSTGRFTLRPTTAVHAPGAAAPAADLLRTLLRPATGLPLPPAADGTVVLAVDPADRELGAEGYRLSVTPEGSGWSPPPRRACWPVSRRSASCCLPRPWGSVRHPAPPGTCPA